jgi:hypothetical protein
MSRSTAGEKGRIPCDRESIETKEPIAPEIVDNRFWIGKLPEFPSDAESDVDDVGDAEGKDAEDVLQAYGTRVVPRDPALLYDCWMRQTGKNRRMEMEPTAVGIGEWEVEELEEFVDAFRDVCNNKKQKLIHLGPFCLLKLLI